MDARLEIYTLGGVRILRGGEPVAELTNRKAEALLIYLASTRRAQSREVLAELLWDERTQSQAMGYLRVTLSALRKALGGGLILGRETLALNPSVPVWLDALQLEDCLKIVHQQGRVTDETAGQVADALELYRGEFLEGFHVSDCRGFEEWGVRERERLHRLAVDGLYELVAYEIERGECQLGMGHAARLLELDPLMEAAHRQMMRLLAGCGQRTAALGQYETCRRLLREELGAEPEAETRELYECIRMGKEVVVETPPAVSFEWLSTPHHNLPSLVSSFIGRVAELARVHDLVRSHRLVTLTGAGGVGKTRLALKAAEDLLGDFQQEVFWVELASLSQSELVARTVLKVFRLPPHMIHNETEQLVDYLKDRHLLLLLDNCEHLLPTCSSWVDTLLKNCPRLHILITSRVRLNLPGEITYLVPSLAAPDSALNRPLFELAQYDAVRLFSERSSSFSQGFSLTEGNAAAVVQICQHLDGIPLALELAAARSRLMSPEQIVGQLSDIFHLLTGGSPAALPRHRTLQASIEWSVSLLPPKELLLLQRLSIFSGGWSLEGALAVCAGEEIHPSEVLDLLAGLVDHSLVIADTPARAEVRYRLLETVRQFAQNLLQENDQDLLLRQRHLAYFLHLAEQADEELRGPRQLLWIKRLDQERGNLNDAIEWSLGTNSHLEMGVNLVSALSDYWGKSGDFIHLARVLRKALSKSASLGRTAARARILIKAARASMWRQHRFLSYSQAMTCLEESLEIWRELGEEYLHEQGQCQTYLGILLGWYLGWMQKNDSNIETGLVYFNAALDIFEQLGSTWWLAWAKSLIWDIHEQSEDASTLRALWEEIITLWRKTGDLYGEAITVMDWGQFALRHGNLSEAKEYFLSSLKLFAELGLKGNYVYQILRDLGHAARALQEYDQAVLYSTQSADLAEKLGWTRFVPDCSLGFAYLYTGDDRRAQANFIHSLHAAQSDNREDLVLTCLACFASLFVVQRKLADAARLFGSCIDRLDTHQEQIYLLKMIDMDHFLDLCKEQLEKAAFSQDWEEGALMTLEQSLAYTQELLE